MIDAKHRSELRYAISRGADWREIKRRFPQYQDRPDNPPHLETHYFRWSDPDGGRGEIDLSPFTELTPEEAEDFAKDFGYPGRD